MWALIILPQYLPTATLFKISPLAFLELRIEGYSVPKNESCVLFSSPGSSRGRRSSRNSHHAKSRRCVKINGYTHTDSRTYVNLLLRSGEPDNLAGAPNDGRCFPHALGLSSQCQCKVAALPLWLRLERRRRAHTHTFTHTVQHFLPSPSQSDVILTQCLGSDIMADLHWLVNV